MRVGEPARRHNVSGSTNSLTRWTQATVAEHLDDLRAVTAAADATRADEARLTEAVQTARAHGKSWNQIAVALGVSRQAAHQRFADKLPT